MGARRTELQAFEDVVAHPIWHRGKLLNLWETGFKPPVKNESTDIDNAGSTVIEHRCLVSGLNCRGQQFH
jgi:hypothetical protein